MKTELWSLQPGRVVVMKVVQEIGQDLGREGQSGNTSREGLPSASQARARGTFTARLPRRAR